MGALAVMHLLDGPASVPHRALPRNWRQTVSYKACLHNTRFDRHTEQLHGADVRCYAQDSRVEVDEEFMNSPRQRTRLADSLLAMPSRIDAYFEGGPGPYRRIIWLCISFMIGFYSANVVSLSFGALAVNDVVAAIVTVVFCEVVSQTYWSANSPGFQIVLLQAFKLGVTAALITDALKLQS